MNMIKVGNNIQTLRKNLKITQGALAERIGVTAQAVSKWEKGESLPETYYLPMISELLGASIDELLRDEPNVSKKTKGKVNINDIVKGIDSIREIKDYLGEDSIFYLGAIKGINESMNLDFNYLYENNKNVLLLEAIIQSIHQGYEIDKNDIEKYFNDEYKTYDNITKYDSMYWENVFMNKVNEIK